MNVPIGMMVQAACVWEATARKPGNVHRCHDFEDLSYVDLLLSAAAIAPILDSAPDGRVGEIVWQGVQAPRRVVSSDTNLGSLLLLAPLAAVPASVGLRDRVGKVLDDLDRADSRAVYRAIQLARPAGLGDVPEQDVKNDPTLPLKE